MPKAASSRPAPALGRILDAVLDGLIVLDANGRIETINAEACRMLEVSAEAGPGRQLEELLGERHPVQEWMRNEIRAGQPIVIAGLKLKTRFRESMDVEVAVSPIQGKDGGADGTVIVLRDRTIGNTLRNEVSEREQLKNYGLIAAGIAHEVKNPLGGIRGTAELLQLWARDDRARGAAELIVREVDRISSLVEELMVFAKGEELDVASFNLHRLLDHVLSLVEAEPQAQNIAFDRVYDPSIPDLLGDENRLTQVFLNLARNGVQAMGEEGGQLRITTGMTLHHRVIGADGRPVPTVEICVEDTGPGIPSEILDRLATPFFTTKAKGTGLGLAVSRHWVNRHGGRLAIEGEANPDDRGEADRPGARVSIYLPLRAIDLPPPLQPGA